MSNSKDVHSVKLPECDTEALQDFADDLGESKHGAHQRALRWGLNRLGYDTGTPMPMNETAIQQSVAELARFSTYSALTVLALHVSTAADVGIYAFMLLLLAAVLLGVERLEPKLTEAINEWWSE